MKPVSSASPSVCVERTGVHGEPDAGAAPSDHEAVERLNQAYRKITGELGKVIVGQQQVIEELLVGMFAGGHCLLVGVPGLAKTLMSDAGRRRSTCSFNRIQFTPDLMPADITGTEVIQEDRTTGSREFRFLPGPIFANVILADEINRTPPKTQAALLEAMQEHQVTAGGKRHQLPEPFFVLATQNPIEQEGTYPLPEAQLDRFMFNILVDYPAEEEEFDIVRRRRATHAAGRADALGARTLPHLQQIVRRVPVADHVVRYAMQFARLTRRQQGDVPDFIRDYVSWGAGPRASQYLILGAKARAVLHGRVLRQHRRHPRGGRSRCCGTASHQLQRRGRRGQARRHRPPADRSWFRVRFAARATQGWTITGSISIRRRWRSSPGLTSRRRLIVEGYVSGVHSSPYHGFSIEFAEHREYAPGDDLRYVDWKVFGKTDKFYLKQFEEETNLACHLLLDTSESMPYRSPGAAVSKLEYAQYVAAALAYLVLHQQDTVGLATFDTSVTRVSPALQPSLASEADSCTSWSRRVAGGETRIGPDLSRPGRADQEARAW